MKHLRFISFLSLALVLGSTLYLVTSCNPDPCKDVICNNGGIATASADNNDCTCACPAGYEGEFCDDFVRDKYVGNYNGTETCDSGTYSIAITAAAGSGSDLELTIGNLYDAGFFTIANVTANGDLEITNQAFGTGTISGSGSINSSGVISITYTIVTGVGTDNCAFVSN